MSTSTLEAPAIDSSFLGAEPAEVCDSEKVETTGDKTAFSLWSFLPLAIAFAILFAGIAFMVGYHMALEMALNNEMESMMKVVEQHRSKG